MSTSSHSAIVNPADSGYVQLFRVAPKTHTLGFEQRPISGGVVNVWKTNSDLAQVPSPVLQAPSAVVTLIFESLVHVYAVHADTNLVTLVSPYVDPVSPPTKSVSGYIAGCVHSSSDSTSAFIYYQETPKTGASVIKVNDVSNPESSSSAIRATEIQPNTWLAAISDDHRVWVFYQNTNNIIIAYNTTRSKSSSVFDESEFFIAQSPIGAIFVSNDELTAAGVPKVNPEALGRVFVYYINKVNDELILHRSWGDSIASDADIKFSKPEQVGSQAIQIQKDAQISVVVDRKAHVNRLFVARKADVDKVSLVTDVFHYK